MLGTFSNQLYHVGTIYGCLLYTVQTGDKFNVKRVSHALNASVYMYTREDCMTRVCSNKTNGRVTLTYVYRNFNAQF